MWMFLQGF
ncbi:hypothetical protein LINPERHAP2_LOCUS25733 [Linum perenne]